MRRPTLKNTDVMLLRTAYAEFGDVALLRLAERIEAALAPQAAHRPRGSGQYSQSDELLLDEIADNLVRGVAVTASASCRRLVAEGRAKGNSPQAAFDRLRTRWRKSAAQRLAAARRLMERKS